jgi:hypothetical protein
VNLFPTFFKTERFSNCRESLEIFRESGLNEGIFAGCWYGVILAFVRTMGRGGRGHQVEDVNEHQERFVYDAPPLWPDSRLVGVTPQQVARLMPAPTSEQYKIIDVLLTHPDASDYSICKEVWDSKQLIQGQN